MKQGTDETTPQARAAVQQFMHGASVFIENQGQWPAAEIRYALNSMGANVGLTEQGPKFQLFRKTAGQSTSKDSADPGKALKDAPPPSEMHAFGLVFDGAAAVSPAGRGRAESTFNYTIGAPENRRENVPSFNAVWYESLYPGVSLEVTGRRSGIKYNFHVAPGADWKTIRLRYDNIQGLSLRADGALEIRVKDGWEPLTDAAPCIYQEINGAKKTVAGAFHLLDDHTYGFEVTGDYDNTLPLVIDPELGWSTHVGGVGENNGFGIAADGSGNIYLTGVTSASGWVSGGWDTSFGAGTYDAYVVKLDSAGTHVWSTYLGGAAGDVGQGVAVDGGGNVYATGYTTSSGWVSGGWNTSYGGGHDAYVVKLNSAGAHVWSTYLGGNGDDLGYGIAVDYSGNAFATGRTSSAGWVSGGWDTMLNDGGTGNDGYVVKLSSAGEHVWSTYLGGNGDDRSLGVAVDGNGNVYATGKGGSGWVSGGWRTVYGGGPYDGFVVKLSATGEHVWSTYLGGKYEDAGQGIAVDGSGNVFATGYTLSPGWISGGWDVMFEVGDSRYDGYVVKLGSDGRHLWSTYLGSTGEDRGIGIAVDNNGNAYATGYTASKGWVSGGWNLSQKGTSDGYIVKLDTAGSHVWSSYIGDIEDDCVQGVAVDGTGDVYVTGYTKSPDWVIGSGYSNPNGHCDALVAKIVDSGQAGSLQETLSPALAVAAGAKWRRVGTTTWMISGDTETGVPAGNWLVEFKDVLGWGPPEPHTVTVISNNAALDAGKYVDVSADMAWSTYLGGAENDYGRNVAVDANGNVFVTGSSASAGWISNGGDTSQNGGVDAFVVKLNAAGARVWSTYLGGSGDDEGTDVAVDNSGNVYVTGSTTSSGWTSGGWKTGYLGGTCDAFAAKLDANGNHVWSTYLGGSGYDKGYGVAVDADGSVYATGCTAISNWASGGWDTTHNGGSDAYAVKLSGAGAHIWSTYMGGTGDEFGFDITLDHGGNVYVTGSTTSSGWTSGGWNTTQDGDFDAFLVKLDAAGQHLWSSYLGGAGHDDGVSVAVDGSDNVCVTGYTDSAGWVSGGWTTTLQGRSDGYVVKLNAAGEHLWSTYLGGTGGDSGYGIAADTDGNEYVTGITNSAGWVSGGNTLVAGADDGFLVKLGASGEHIWSTYMGGAASDSGQGVAVDGIGNIYVAGWTTSAGWVSGGWNTAFQGGYDAFVAKYIEIPPGPPTGTITINGGAASTNHADVTLSLTWSERKSIGVTAMRFSDDGAHWTLWEPVAASVPHALPGTDGYKTVRAQYRDALGRVSERFNDYILLDTTAPTGTIVINGNAPSTTSPNVTLSLAWSDGTGTGVTRMRFSDDGAHWTAWEPVVATKAHTLPGTNGYKTVRVQYRDAAGNVSNRFNDYILLSAG